MEHTLLLFARLAEIAGSDRLTLALSSDTSAEAILAAAAHARPALAPVLRTCRVAVDQVFVRGPLTLTATSEIALIPPVSGG